MPSAVRELRKATVYSTQKNHAISHIRSTPLSPDSAIYMPYLECMIKSEIQTPSKKSQKSRLVHVRVSEAPFDTNSFCNICITTMQYDSALYAPAHLGGSSVSSDGIPLTLRTP